MPSHSPDAVVTFSIPVAIAAKEMTSPLEEEVIRLFDELRHPVIRYLVSLGIAPAQSEETVQEVFLCLFRHMQSGKSRKHLRAWVFRVARNLALRQHRANRRKPEQLFGLDVDSHNEPHDPSPNPEESTINRRRQERLLAVLSAMPDHEQQGLHLRAEGLRHREISKVLGISRTTLTQMLSRSLAKLQRVYES
jgi:RNA polymerase sigma-70 factor (ECF subfamily)